MSDREKFKARSEEPDVEAHGKKAAAREEARPDVEDKTDDQPDVEAHGKMM